VPIVLNEWLIHDLRGDNGPVAQIESAKFLSAFQQGTDYIVVMRPSQWTRKAYELMTVSTPPVRILSQLLHLGILQDALKCRYMEAADSGPLPSDLAEHVPDDDVYLFQTALTANTTNIVTTDTRLIERAATAALERGIRMQVRREFLAEYHTVITSSS
jgi:hypothetical protein